MNLRTHLVAILLGESMNRGTVWTVTLVMIMDYIQMQNLKPCSKLELSTF
jgi:hypothetical protein